MNVGQIIDGRKHAQRLVYELQRKVMWLRSEYDITPTLAAILVGNDTSSNIYVKRKAIKAKEIGIKALVYKMHPNISEAELLAKIKELNHDKDINGILIQLPLPAHLNTHEVIEALNPKKDVDGLHPYNVGLLNTWQDCLKPCTPYGIMLLLEATLGKDLSGKKAVVLGRSRIVGRPMISMLLKANCSVLALHSYSKYIAKECSTADILISAVGSAAIVKKEWVMKGACVIDVGMVRIKDKLYGDVDFEEVSRVAGFITPVPGGVGQMTVACLLANTIKATCIQHEVIW